MGDREEFGYDAIVIGSGYGGSVAACRLSQAGIKVCLLEKGRRWKAEDFPTDALKMMSAVRMENQNLGISFGPKHALFQVYEQNDSLAAVACGLGGGSLVNAGVMLPTPVRARRNPKWPKEWEKNWDICEASAAAMLRIQSVPVKFPNVKVMREIFEGETEETVDNLMNLSINFDVEEPPSNSLKLQQTSSCLACGNCIAGCPYNAKNSTDKNYILSAVQAGCTVRTECQVQYVTENMHEVFQQEISRKRRWRVYLNEIDYITSDFVILSAGVFGTTEILFRSQMRGLRLSKALGSGFSCNGNTVAYLAGSTAPLSGYGLDRKQMSTIPFQERPGPSISSAFTSSLGFTIQSAVLPRAYPYLLFKGIVSYGWPTGYWFFHGIIDKLKHITGLKSTQAIVLNAMGYDESDGNIVLDKNMDKICFTPPHDPLLPQKIEAYQKLTKKLGGFLFIPRPLCLRCFFNPMFVGLNPCLTIATAAEHVSRHIVQNALDYKGKRDKNFDILTVDRNSGLVADKNSDIDHNSIVLFNETLRGYVGEDGHFISCRHWKCIQSPRGLKGEKQLNPVLLLNGYVTESYWLPTEPHDLIRTLLEEGHETWLLQPRLHPMNPANSFTIEDIGKYDIPAAINMILELHGLGTKIHVIAHCVGGLAIHIALMGGHVSAAHVASLSCTNSSMFFKLITLARIKMWLPLVPLNKASHGSISSPQKNLQLWIYCGQERSGPPHDVFNNAKDLANLVKSHGWSWPDVVIGHSMGGKVALQFAQSCSRGDYGESAVWPKQLWALDSVPGDVKLETSDEVEKVLKTLQSLPSSFPSRKWLVNHMIELGFCKPKAEWISNYLKKSGEQEIWESSYWSLLEHPPKGMEINIVVAEKSDCWEPDVIQRLESLDSQKGSGSEGKVSLHVLQTLGIGFMWTIQRVFFRLWRQRSFLFQHKSIAIVRGFIIKEYYGYRLYPLL
ncbi:hypothetical protein GH714_038134 [Hevea brasiliensis]|uniref:Uncharacterized protein n=1 Tax=Hevea brasiliensis TaxID=3981 RepID=A0A6A6KL72_HEVBR|nr:hypothetical protein GH714_038134 [Hevea brasiliensis]